MTLRISRETRVCGVPATALRDRLKKLRPGGGFRVRYLTGLVSGPTAAKRLVKALLTQGYIESEASRSDLFTLTDKGIQLVHASAMKPIPRSRATELLEAYVQRLLDVRNNPYWLWEASQARLYGSFLDPTKDALGDIDLAHELVPKEPDADKRNALLEQRREELDSDRRFKSWLERLGGPETEVEDYLRQGKSGRRNPYLSFHSLDDFVLKQARSVVIYTKGRGILRAWRWP
jgi:hypothetical protein